jgi:hypothetical protein
MLPVCVGPIYQGWRGARIARASTGDEALCAQWGAPGIRYSHPRDAELGIAIDEQVDVVRHHLDFQNTSVPFGADIGDDPL